MLDGDPDRNPLIEIDAAQRRRTWAKFGVIIVSLFSLLALLISSH